MAIVSNPTPRTRCPSEPGPPSHSLASCLQKAAELKSALSVLEQAGIPAIVFKGPALSVLAYGTLGPRPFTDLDILVPESGRDAAISALLAAGYDWIIGPHAAAVPGAIEADLTNGRCAIDLHWALLPRYFGRIDLAAEDTWTVDIAGFPAVTLKPEPALVHLSADYARDLWPTPSRARDIAALIQRHPIDWDRVRHLAAKWRFRRAVALALELARAIEPEHLLSESFKSPSRGFRPPAASVLARWQSGAPLPNEACFHLPILDTPARRAAYLLRRVFQPTQQDAAWLRLPAPLHPAYYAVRPLRLALAAVSFGRIR